MKKYFSLVLVVMALVFAPVFAPAKPGKVVKPPVPGISECMPKPPGMSPDWCKVR